MHQKSPRPLVHAHNLSLSDAHWLVEKQHYTLLDMLVCQHILNGGILMRQRHNTEKEHHVDLNLE